MFHSFLDSLTFLWESKSIFYIIQWEQGNSSITGSYIYGEEAYKFAEGPLLQQILAQKDAMIPVTMKIRVVTKNPISIRSHQPAITES